MTIYSLPAYQDLAEKIASVTGATIGGIECRRFPNGERYMRILSAVRDEDAVIVAGTVDDTATLDLFDLACGLVTDGCRSLKILIPFFSYSTMERATKSGEVVTAKTRARLLSAVPTAPFGNQVVMLDLHAEGIPFYFEGNVKTHHLYAKPLIIREARRLGGDHFVLGAVDAGRAKWVQSLANDMHVPAGFVYKMRSDAGQITVSGTNIAVHGLPVVIYDDMIRSGGSIIQAAQAYKAAGATEISVITTHGDFTPEAVPKLRASQLFRELVCTDSHPCAQAIQKLHPDPWLKIISTAEIFSEFLR
jgi:ribose-phosphate pyrophosphokinase